MANTKNKRKPFFEVYPSNGEFRWRLKGANGEIMASGESYGGERGMRNAGKAIKSIKEAIEMSDIRYLDENGLLVKIVSGETGVVTIPALKKQRLPHQNPRGRAK